MQNEQRNQRMMMSNPMNAQYQNVGNMMRGNMPNGVAQNDLKRAALQNNRPYVSPAVSCPTYHHANMQQQRQPHGQHGPDEQAQHDGSTNAAGRLADGHERPACPVAEQQRECSVPEQAASD